MGNKIEILIPQTFSWKNAPTEAESYNRMTKTNYFVGIDENGNTTGIKKNFKKFINDIPLAENEKYIGITATFIESSKFEKFRKDLINIKKKYWGATAKTVVLHYSDIVHGKKPLRLSTDKKNELLADIALLLQKQELLIFTSIFNITTFAYDSKTDLYQEHLRALLLKLGKNMVESNKTFQVLIECRDHRKTKDKQTHKCLVDKVNKVPAFFTTLEGIYFNTKKHTSNDESYAILELADIVAGAIYSYSKSNIVNTIYEAIKDKIVYSF